MMGGVRMAGNYPATVMIRVESTSGIVVGKNIISRNLRCTPCYVLFKYNNHEQRVDDKLTPCSSSYRAWNKEVCFQIDSTHGDCVLVNMYRDKNRFIGGCDIFLSEVPNVNQRPFRKTFKLRKQRMPPASNEGDVQGLLTLRVTFNWPAQGAPYPPPPPSYPQEWPRSQPPQLMYPPGPRQLWPNGQQQAHSPFYSPGPPQNQWQDVPLAVEYMPNLHPGSFYPPNHNLTNHNQGNRQAPHPDASPDLSGIPIAEIYPPPVSFTPSRSHQDHTVTDPFVWSSAEHQADQSLLASASTGTDDEEEDSEMRNFLEAFAPSLDR